VASWDGPTLSDFIAEWSLPDTIVRVNTELQGNKIVARGPVVSNGDIHGFRLAGWSASSDTIRSPVSRFAASDPASPPAAFYFNRSLDTSFSDGSAPDGVGSSVIETDIIRRIDEAVATLDVAMYNTSRDAIVQALRRAAARGVVIRYVADSETSNGALDGPLPFPVLYREGDGIMHHKFVVGDVADAQRAWVWAGSTNFSANQLSQDPNHAIVLRDPAIAQTYTREFDEMWGTLPGFQDSRTGDLKVDDTPHDFVVGSVPVSVYFSPSDETGCHILDALESADAQILAGLLLLTRDELIDALIRRHRDGLDVRVIVDDEESSEEALARLRAAGVPVRVHRFSPIFHHKYAVIDEGREDPVVATGSHNWTFSADRINDENVLVFRDQRTANIFRQEFEARWAELQLTATVKAVDASMARAFPNPATDWVVVNNHAGQDCTLTVSNALGQHVYTAMLPAGDETTISLSGMTPQPVVVTWTWPFGRKAAVVNVIR
jgi:phosphatidylserine/phosphatidylglycerophosphate/cardiolipin synthase-like enzyme